MKSTLKSSWPDFSHATKNTTRTAKKKKRKTVQVTVIRPDGEVRTSNKRSKAALDMYKQYISEV